MAVNTIVHSPLVISGLFSFEQDISKFIIQIRKKGTSLLLADVEVGAVKAGLQWRNEPYVFPESIKDTAYQVRTAVKNFNGNISAFSDWVNETAGDNSFGSGHSWEQVETTIVPRSTCIDISITLTDPPLDFQRTELYVRTGDSTSGYESWEPDAIRAELSFAYPWVGERQVARWFFVRAFDASGNSSALWAVGTATQKSEGVKITLVGDNDFDTTPPESSTVTAALED